MAPRGRIYLNKHNKKEVLPQMLRPIPQNLRIRHALLLHYGSIILSSRRALRDNTSIHVGLLYHFKEKTVVYRYPRVHVDQNSCVYSCTHTVLYMFECRHVCDAAHTRVKSVSIRICTRVLNLVTVPRYVYYSCSMGTIFSTKF